MTRKLTARLLALFLALFLLPGCGGGQTGGGFSHTPPPETSSPAQSTEGSSFEVHYIDVGQADAALVLCDGEAMLIDGGNRGDSSLLYSYLETQGVAHLDYVVATHGHEDHVGGLSGALNYATAGVALAPVTEYDSEVFRNFVKTLDKQNVDLTVPSPGDTFDIGSAEATVLGPIHESDDPNNTSIVLRVVYGNTSFLFTGDAERPEEEDILNSGAELESTVLKVGHHGSENSTTYPFLREIMPEYAVISVGEGNSYGHPTQAALSRLEDAGVEVYRTDLQGHIICTSDGESVSFSTEKEIFVENEPVSASYILNTSSRKFHLPTCPSAADIGPKNRGTSNESRDTLVEQGYAPCGRCKP